MSLTAALLFFLLVLGINLLPAFGPPTWSVIVLYALNSELGLAILIPTGALAAAAGRLGLAHAFRLLGDRLPDKRKRSLAAARATLGQRKRGAFVGLALFALSPVPSAQLFEAAGLMKVKLAGFTAAFFAGRIVSYSIYAGTARSLKATNLGDTFRDALTSPTGIAIQLVAIIALVVLARVDWARRLAPDPDQRAANSASSRG